MPIAQPPPKAIAVTSPAVFTPGTHLLTMPKSPVERVPITPIPANSGSIVRRAFLVESLFNLGTLPLLTHTRSVLALILARPCDINPSSIFLARIFAGIVVGALTPALWFGTANTRTGVECRRPVYLLLGGGEACLIPVLVMEALKKGGSSAAISSSVAWMMVGTLLPILTWRAFVLFLRPEMLGEYVDKKD